MKKFVPILLLAGGIMFVSAQGVQFSGCVTGELAGVTGCICTNTATGQIQVVVNSYCSASGVGGAGGPLLQLLAMAQTIVNRLVPFLIGLAIVAFFWFLVTYIFKGDESADKRQEGLRGMGYSIIAIFVMVAIWGIIAFISSVTGIGVGGGLPPLVMPTAR